VGLGIARAAADGNAAVFSSWGIFGDAAGGMPVSYRAKRAATGWSSNAVSHGPATPYPDSVSSYNAAWEDASRDLSVGFLNTRDPLDPLDVNDGLDIYASNPGVAELLTRGNGAERTQASNNATRFQITPDGSAVVFQTASHLVPEDSGRVAQAVDVYERKDGVTRLVNQADGGGLQHACGSRLGSRQSERHAVTGNGERVIFTTPAEYFDVNTAPSSCSDPTEIYMRIGGARTIHVSASQLPGGDPNGVAAKIYEGASADGELVFFQTSEMLTPDATTGGGVYRYSVSSRRLELIIPFESPAGLSTINVAKISADGSRVYFLSYVDLAPGGVVGVENLYLYAEGEPVRYVATSPTGIELGAIASENEAARPAQVTPDGRYLLFATTADLTDFDNADRAQVYLYSEEAERLLCLSCDPAAQRPDTSAVASDASITSPSLAGVNSFYYDDATPSITADGRTVVFQTGDQLVPEDRNNRTDIYEYRGGRLSLVSTGRGSTDSFLIAMAGDGRDVFFATSESLVPIDVDGGNIDIYDARVGGGFRYPTPVTRTPCLGDACQKPPSSTPEPDILGTEQLSGDGQSTEVDVEPTPKSVRVVAVGRAAKQRFARTGTLRLKVITTGGGTVTARALTRADRRDRTVGTARKYVRATKRTTSTIVLRLNRSGMKMLRSGRLSLRLVVRLSGLSKSRTTSMTLTRNRT
jgi:Tol biopolymer transport system component